jgi:serine phosphatase RsbU (regulator of sigma subunit)
MELHVDAGLVEMNELKASMTYAAAIQQGLLPRKRHFDRLLKQHFLIYKPQNIIGGDFYWIAHKNDKIIFATADCTGHGIPASLLSVLGISFLNYVVLGKEFDDLGLILREIDKKWMETFNTFTEHQEDNDWMEISLCSYDKRTGELFFAGANSAIITANEQGFTEYKGNKYPIGGWQMESNRNFTQQQIKLDPDTRLYLFSDGFQDQFGGHRNKKYSANRLYNFIHNIYDLPMVIQGNMIKAQLEEWQGENPQTDDICLMGIKLT